MKKSRIHVLIVDDDATQGNALLQAFQRAGYQATWANTSVKGLTTAQRQEFHCLIVDCMLPKMNGPDLVEEIKAVAVQMPKVFMVSGIYKDKSFIKETMERTGALNFFVKPLDLNDLIGQVDAAFADQLGDDDPPLLALYETDPMTDDDLVRLIAEEGTVHSIHLPMLYKRLQATGLSGELQLVSSVGDVSTILIYQGQIFAVRTPDKDTYFGGLAVGFGFVEPDEVMHALKNPARKMLGQKLIESMSLSPHAIHVILEEQLALRLSQSIQSGVFSLQWTPRPFPAPEYALHPKRFEALLGDWTRSKIDHQWIKANLALWGKYTLQGHTHSHINDAITVDELLSHPDFVDRDDLPYLLRQILMGNAFLGPRGGAQQNFEFLESRLTQLLEDYKTQNYFQVLGVGEKAQALELNKAFHDLREHFDPKNLAADAPPSVMVKCAKVFQQIETAYHTLSDESARTKYLLLEQNKRGHAMLENEPVFRAAILELQNGHAAEAAVRFDELLAKRLPFKDLRAYRIWAGLKVDRRYDAITLDQVPPEERHSAAYHMAKGVYQRGRGQIAKALESYRTAHILDPRMSIARKELEKLRADVEGNRDLMKEVTSVVDALFGKSRRSA